MPDESANAPTPSSAPDRIEEITHVVLQVIETQAKKPQSLPAAAVDCVTRTWPVVLSLAALVLAILIAPFFGISPWLFFQERADRQSDLQEKNEERNFKKRMLARHIDLGNQFLGLEQILAAQAEFERALKLNPISVEAKRGIFKCELCASISKPDYDPEIMERRATKLLEEIPGDPHVLMFLGSIYQGLKRPEDALKCFREACENEVPAGCLRIGVMYHQQGDLDKAQEMYKKALGKCKWSQLFLNNLAAVYYHKRQYDEAAEQYALIIRLDDRHLLAHCQLANSLRLSGNLAASHSVLERLVWILDGGIKDALELERNRLHWSIFLVRSGKNIILDSDQAKKSLVYYQIALSSFLLGRKKEARKYVAGAKGLDIDDLKTIRLLIKSYIQDLRESRPEFKPGTEGFQKAFLEY